MSMLFSERRSAAAIAANLAWTSSGTRALICFMPPVWGYDEGMGNRFGDIGRPDYKRYHRRVKMARGTADRCIIYRCATGSTTYDWANISEKYADIWDYMPMCHTHHLRHDYERRGGRGRSQNLGVSWAPSNNKWRVDIKERTPDRKPYRVLLGYFSTEEDAAKAREAYILQRGAA